MRLSRDQDTFTIQNGLVFEESGKQVEWDAVPGWVFDAMELANPDAVKETGWKGKPEIKGAKAK
jgi:hypothetical protein